MTKDHLHGSPSRELRFNDVSLLGVDDVDGQTIVRTGDGDLTIGVTPLQLQAKLSLAGVTRRCLEGDRLRVAISGEGSPSIVAIGYHNPRVHTALRAIVSKMRDVDVDVVDGWVLQGCIWRSSRIASTSAMPSGVTVFEGALSMLMKDGVKDGKGLVPFVLNDACVTLRRLPETFCEAMPGMMLDDVVRSRHTEGIGLRIARVSSSGDRTHLHLDGEIVHLEDGHR